MIELNGIQLDKTSAVPLYEQLRKALLEAITSGKLSAGTKLPTEEELCAQFGISRPVARQAYNMLIEEGFVERMRGRGTFVRSPDTRVQAMCKRHITDTDLDFPFPWDKCDMFQARYPVPHRTCRSAWWDRWERCSL